MITDLQHGPAKLAKSAKLHARSDREWLSHVYVGGTFVSEKQSRPTTAAADGVKLSMSGFEAAFSSYVTFV